MKKQTFLLSVIMVIVMMAMSPQRLWAEVEGHELQHTAAKAATCTEVGNIEYWYCSVCDKYYSDEDGTTEITSAETVIAAAHTLSFEPAREPTCERMGNIAYYFCTECFNFFRDAEGLEEIERWDIDIFPDPNAHSLTHHNRVEPTCTTTGIIEYYVCYYCERMFTDSEGQKEVWDTTLPTTGHDFIGTWSDVTGGKTMACKNGCGKACYTMDAAGKNAIALTLTSELDGVSKLTFPFIEDNAPVLTQDDDNYTVAFSLEGSAETMTIQKSLISKVSVLWSHDFSTETQNADKSYSHKCSVTDCDVMGDDLYVKINGENVDATKEGDVLKVESLVLTDDNGYSCEATFTIGTATYNRTMTNQWGTLCLPISLTVDTEKNAYDFYTLVSINDTNDELTIEKVADGTLAEGTPVIVRRNADESGISIGETNASVCTQPATGSTAGDLTLTGTYTTEDITGEYGYFISNDAFWNIEDGRNVRVAPFRAWIKSPTACNAKKLTLCFDDGATAIDMLNAADDSETAAIYDLQGHRLSDLRQGVNIVKFSNGQTKKIIIK